MKKSTSERRVIDATLMACQVIKKATSLLSSHSDGA